MACTREHTTDGERATSCTFKIVMILLAWNLIPTALVITAFVELRSNLKGELERGIKVNESRPALVHLTGHHSDRGKLNDEVLDIWKTASSKMTSLGANLSSIIIKESGNYFVYAQLYFQVPFNSKLDKFDQSYLAFFVCRISKATTSILMRAVASNGFQGKKNVLTYHKSFRSKATTS
ncbi:uncharacterized protein LOC114535243 isoform X2 [Dendronephthya gigantea]|uniref:uncharacterized protein LOC114535243 isoform X2 n=1 Tax=Dendronephthya gigantea TaxID=151771 RepID=UPI0010693FDF|nr:uncharacterized protein LOC114535243 isoform X2 [Dendronephthya gigantea]